MYNIDTYFVFFEIWTLRMRWIYCDFFYLLSCLQVLSQLSHFFFHKYRNKYFMINFNAHSTISGNWTCIQGLPSLFLELDFHIYWFSWFSLDTVVCIRYKVPMILFYIISSISMVLNFTIMFSELYDHCQYYLNC